MMKLEKNRKEYQNIEPFINKYNWKGIKDPSGKDV